MRIDPPNPVVFGKNNVVDWKGPLQLPGRLVPGREAFFRLAIAEAKVQRKVQNGNLSSQFGENYILQHPFAQALTAGGSVVAKKVALHRNAVVMPF